MVFHFTSHDKWLTSLIIHAFLETSNKNTDIPSQMKKREKKSNRNASDQQGLSIYEDELITEEKIYYNTILPKDQISNIRTVLGNRLT